MTNSSDLNDFPRPEKAATLLYGVINSGDDTIREASKERFERLKSEGFHTSVTYGVDIVWQVVDMNHNA